MTARGAPPTVATKYEFVQSVGNRDRNAAQTILALADLNQTSVDGVRRTTEAYVLVGAT